LWITLVFSWSRLCRRRTSPSACMTSRRACSARNTSGAWMPLPNGQLVWFYVSFLGVLSEYIPTALAGLLTRGSPPLLRVCSVLPANNSWLHSTARRRLTCSGRKLRWAPCRPSCSTSRASSVRAGGRPPAKCASCCNVSLQINAKLPPRIFFCHIFRSPTAFPRARCCPQRPSAARYRASSTS